MRCLAFLAAGFVGVSAHADWPGFRGDGSAVSADLDVPATISTEALRWKVKLPGLGASSPIVVGERIFLTCYSGYGEKLTEGFKSGGFMTKGKVNPEEQAKLRLWLLCLDRAKGEVLWKKEMAPKLPEAPFASFLREHGYASSTPVSDGQSVYVFFGKTGVFAFDLDGKELWRREVGDGVHEWGSASSPALTRNTLVLNASIEAKGLVAFDKRTGKEVWRTKDLPICWTSPVVVNLKDGKQEVVLSAPGKVIGYEPDSGEVLWTCKGLGGGGISGATCSTPAVQGERLFIMSAGPSTPPTMLALRAGGRGDVTATHLLWTQKVGGGICSPVAAGTHVYFVDGFANCLNAEDGKVVYKERIYDARGEYASAVLAGGRLYALSRFDGLFVLKAGEKFERLAQHTFEGDNSIFNATPAIAAGRLFIRSNEYLYCFAKK
jgi:outer membrane protein assembly factor BamB